MTRVRVLYFASLRDAAGVDSESVDGTAADLRALYEDRQRRHGFALPVSQLRVAVDGAFAHWDDAPRDGSEVGVHSPGQWRLMQRFRLSDVPFDTATLRAELLDARVGAYASFEGWIRDHNDGRHVHGLHYEAYAALAEAEGKRIVDEALSRFDIIDAHCVHRIGDLVDWRAGRLGRRRRRPSRPRIRRLPLHHRRSEIPRPHLETRALRRRHNRLATPAKIANGQVIRYAKPPSKGARPTGAGFEGKAPGARNLRKGKFWDFCAAQQKWRWPRRLTSAPASVDTVAAFRPWRSFRPSVARGRRGHHGDKQTINGGERGIRTPEARFRRLHTFQACSFNRSDTSPLEPGCMQLLPSGPAILAVARGGHNKTRLSSSGNRAFRLAPAVLQAAIDTAFGEGAANNPAARQNAQHVLSRPRPQMAPRSVLPNWSGRSTSSVR